MARGIRTLGQTLTATANPAGLDCTPARRSAACTSGSSVDRTSRIRVFDNSSRVGLRGTEDLGNGLKAIFQIESGVAMDNGSGSGQGGEQRLVGLLGVARLVRRHRLELRPPHLRPPVDLLGERRQAQFAANYINTEIPWTNGTQLGRVSRRTPTPARVSNTAQYTTPTFAGINGTLSYSPNAQEAVQEGQTGTLVNSTGCLGGGIGVKS